MKKEYEPSFKFFVWSHYELWEKEHWASNVWLAIGTLLAISQSSNVLVMLSQSIAAGLGAFVGWFLIWNLIIAVPIYIIESNRKPSKLKKQEK